MRPPGGFEAEKYPLRHRIVYSAGLNFAPTLNTVFLPIVMGSLDMDSDAKEIKVNPHNTGYVEDAGPLVRQMSIIDKLTMSLKFNMTEHCLPRNETSSAAWLGEGLQSIHLQWRPIFGSFGEKLDAADQDTLQTVATILGLTHSSNFEDVVPITTTKLPIQGASDLPYVASTANAIQVIGDMNMSTDFTMEEHVFDEDLFQKAIRRFTNKGALRSCVGRTRHLTLSRNRSYRNYFLEKFVPRAIRRIMPYTFMGIQVHLPEITHASQAYHGSTPGTIYPLIGVSCICNYHEWNSDHDQTTLVDEP